jgi:hypothetical protein
MGLLPLTFLCAANLGATVGFAGVAALGFTLVAIGLPPIVVLSKVGLTGFMRPAFGFIRRVFCIAPATDLAPDTTPAAALVATCPGTLSTVGTLSPAFNFCKFAF